MFVLVDKADQVELELLSLLAEWRQKVYVGGHDLVMGHDQEKLTDAAIQAVTRAAALEESMHRRNQ